MGKIVQTAGRNTLGEFAPEFAHFNDDVLFGENWNNQDIDVKTRSIITVVALMASGITDSSLKYHLQNAKNHGVTQKEIAAVITHAAFYAGWPKAWAVFNLAKEVWETGEGDLPYEEEAMRAHAKEMVFPIGEPNDGFAQYFSGRSFLAPISTSQVGIFNVTFEPGCRNNWHIHHGFRQYEVALCEHHVFAFVILGHGNAIAQILIVEIIGDIPAEFELAVGRSRLADIERHGLIEPGSVRLVVLFDFAMQLVCHRVVLA